MKNLDIWKFTRKLDRYKKKFIDSSFRFDIYFGMFSLFKCYHQFSTFFIIFNQFWTLCSFKSLNLIWYQRIDFFFSHLTKDLNWSATSALSICKWKPYLPPLRSRKLSFCSPRYFRRCMCICQSLPIALDEWWEYCC